MSGERGKMDEKVDLRKIYKVEIQWQDEQSVLLPEQRRATRVTIIAVPVWSVHSGRIQAENTNETELHKDGE